MPRPLLPPRGYFVPTARIFHSELPSAVFLTWLQLRSLAWGINETPSLPIQKLVELTELPRTTLMRHLRLLEQRHLLRWAAPAKGHIKVSFLDDPATPKMVPKPPPNFEQANAPKTARPNLSSPKMAVVKLSQEAGSFNDQDLPDESLRQDESFSLPLEEIKSLDLKDLKKEEGVEAAILNKKHMQDSKDDHDHLGEREGEGERGPNLANPGPPAVRQQPPKLNTPLAIYTAVTGLYPTSPHAFTLLAGVTDLALWHATLQHWAAHALDRADLPAISRLYTLGGPAHCPHCHPEAGSAIRKESHQ